MLASLESKKTATTTKGCPTLSLALKSRVCGVASIPLTGVNIDETGCLDVRKGTQLHEKKTRKRSHLFSRSWAVSSQLKQFMQVRIGSTKGKENPLVGLVLVPRQEPHRIRMMGNKKCTKPLWNCQCNLTFIVQKRKLFKKLDMVDKIHNNLWPLITGSNIDLGWKMHYQSRVAVKSNPLFFFR